MYRISVQKQQGSLFTIAPMSIKRDWMDNTPEKHAYRCFPVTQANMVGWNLYCNEEVKFIWNGITDTSPENVTILQGKSFTYSGRGQSTVSFNTGLIFKTEKDVSFLVINPVNY